MPGTWSKLVTVTTGQLITAAERNNEFDNVITNATPDGCDDASADITAMQATTDPYPGSVASLATDLRGELKRLRYVLKGLSGGAQWYIPAASDIATLSPAVTTLQTYVGSLMKYRRPVLQYSSGTVVNMETGVNGTSGQAQILFPDGTLRTDSTATRINGDVSRVAALSGSWQSGLRTGTVVNNTWYACYAVKTTDDTAKFVMVLDIVLPIQANYATLNSNFGTNGWVYLGMVRYGDQSGTANQIVAFTMSGNFTAFSDTITGNAFNVTGIRMATTASGASLTYTYAAGTNGAVIPSHIAIGTFIATTSATAGIIVSDSSGGRHLSYVGSPTSLGAITIVPNIPLTLGLSQPASTGTPAMDIFLVSFFDPILGNGSNPLL